MWFDSGVVETVVGLIPPWLALVFLAVTFLGSVYVVWSGVLLALLRGNRERTATWPGIVVGAYGLFVTVKPLVYVERPDVDPPLARETLPDLLVPIYDLAVDFTTGSFPSGHVVAAVVFWGLFVADLDWRSFQARFAVATTVVGLVAVSRVVLGVHYVADVVAGVALGGAYLALALAVRERASDPVRATLQLGAAFALGGFLVGRPLDALALLAVTAVAYVVTVERARSWLLGRLVRR